MSSLDSANGPSVTLGLPPTNLTRVPFAGGCNPSRPSSTPALVRDSLYFVILATRSAGGTKSAFAFSYALGITSIMKRIVGTLDWSFEPEFPVSTNASNQGRRNRLALGGLHPTQARCGEEQGRAAGAAGRKRRSRRGSPRRTGAPPVPRPGSRP